MALLMVFFLYFIKCRWKQKQLNIILRMIFPCQIIGIYLKQSFANFIRKSFPLFFLLFFHFSAKAHTLLLIFDQWASICLDITMTEEYICFSLSILSFLQHYHKQWHVHQDSTINIDSAEMSAKQSQFWCKTMRAHHIKSVCIKLNIYIFISIDCEVPFQADCCKCLFLLFSTLNTHTHSYKNVWFN